MNHAAVITFICGSLCIIGSTLPAVIRNNESADFTRAAAALFILGSLMLW